VKALSLWRPWAHLILSGAKTVENRGWPPHADVVGCRIALHSGLRYDFGGWEPAAGVLPPVPPADECPTGIVGLARVLGYRDDRGTTRIVAAAGPGAAEVRTKLERLHEDPFWCGPVGWLLGERVAIPPIPYKGAQGLFRLPPDVARQAMESAVKYGRIPL
jgi:hypothetical protein